MSAPVSRLRGVSMQQIVCEHAMSHEKSGRGQVGVEPEQSVADQDFCSK
jgi:hypothetical protein